MRSVGVVGASIGPAEPPDRNPERRWGKDSQSVLPGGTM